MGQHAAFNRDNNGLLTLTLKTCAMFALQATDT